MACGSLHKQKPPEHIKRNIKFRLRGLLFNNLSRVLEIEIPSAATHAHRVIRSCALRPARNTKLRGGAQPRPPPSMPSCAPLERTAPTQLLPLRAALADTPPRAGSMSSPSAFQDPAPATPREGSRAEAVVGATVSSPELRRSGLRGRGALASPRAVAVTLGLLFYSVTVLALGLAGNAQARRRLLACARLSVCLWLGRWRLTVGTQQSRRC